MPKKLQSQTVFREKLHKALLYKKKIRVKCWWNWHLLSLPFSPSLSLSPSFSLSFSFDTDSDNQEPYNVWMWHDYQFPSLHQRRIAGWVTTPPSHSHTHTLTLTFYTHTHARTHAKSMVDYKTSLSLYHTHTHARTTSWSKDILSQSGTFTH